MQRRTWPSDSQTSMRHRNGACTPASTCSERVFGTPPAVARPQDTTTGQVERTRAPGAPSNYRHPVRTNRSFWLSHSLWLERSVNRTKTLPPRWSSSSAARASQAGWRSRSAWHGGHRRDHQGTRPRSRRVGLRQDSAEASRQHQRRHLRSRRQPAVNEGDRVKQGQFLLQIDPKSLRTRASTAAPRHCRRRRARSISSVSRSKPRACSSIRRRRTSPASATCGISS